jgi:hypothetical protein
MNTKAKTSDLTQQDFGGDCDTPPKPWSDIWVAWNSEDGFTFWDNEKQADLWSAHDSNEWPVKFAMQKAQTAVPLTDKQERKAFETYWRNKYDSTLYCESEFRGWEARAAHGITKGQP